MVSIEEERIAQQRVSGIQQVLQKQQILSQIQQQRNQAQQIPSQQSNIQIQNQQSNIQTLNQLQQYLSNYDANAEESLRNYRGGNPEEYKQFLRGKKDVVDRYARALERGEISGLTFNQVLNEADTGGRSFAYYQSQLQQQARSEQRAYARQSKPDQRQLFYLTQQVPTLKQFIAQKEAQARMSFGNQLREKTTQYFEI